MPRILQPIKRSSGLMAGLMVSIVTFSSYTLVLGTFMGHRDTVQPLAHAGTSTLHFGRNSGVSNLSNYTQNGYKLVDVTASTSSPSSTKTIVDGLPAGTQALVWVGNLGYAPIGSSCHTASFTTTQFRAIVDQLAGDSRVFGYFLSHDPHPSICSSAVQDIASRADYIRSVTPNQKSLIVVLDGSDICGASIGCEYAALNPSKTHVDLVGLDPYPCHYSGKTAVPCDYSLITSRVNTAVGKGIPLSAIVPVFQTFGEEGRTDSAVYYRTPSAAELQSMLATWDAAVPNAVMDYSYSYTVQCSSPCSAPQALANHPELQTVMRQHNVLGAATTPKPTPAPAKTPAPLPPSKVSAAPSQTSPVSQPKTAPSSPDSTSSSQAAEPSTSLNPLNIDQSILSNNLNPSSESPLESTDVAEKSQILKNPFVLAGGLILACILGFIAFLIARRYFTLRQLRNNITGSSDGILHIPQTR